MTVNADSQATRRLTTAIETVMSSAGHPRRRRLAAILKGLAGLYGTGIRCRRSFYRHGWLASHRLACRVVSVGNITLGGTGKTPMTLYLAELIHGAGYRTAVVSRGYKGAAETRGGVVSDGRRLLMGPAEAGDEPYLMARHLLHLGIPVLVGRDRVRSGRLAVDRLKTEVLLLDDGFQHWRIARDLDIVLLDAADPFGNGHLVPRGTLREPLDALVRADACVMTRCPPEAVVPRRPGLPQPGRRIARRADRPIFPAAHAPFAIERITAGRVQPAGATDGMPASREPVYAFSGIARNDGFRRSLQAMGFPLRGWRDFDDHHAYTLEDLRAAAFEAQRCGAELMVTTQKDRVKLKAAWIREVPLLVMGVRMDLGDYAGAFEDFVRRRIGLRPRPGA